MTELDLRSIKKHYQKDFPKLAFYLDPGPEPTATATLPREEMEVRAFETSQMLADEGNDTISEQWLLTPQGWSAVLYGMKNLDEALTWLERMFDETGLEEATVRGGPSGSSPNERDGRATLTAHAVLATKQTRWDKLWLKREERTWSTDPRLTQEIAEQMVSWCHLRNGRDVILRDGGWYVDFDWEDAGPGVADAVEHGTVVLASHLSDPVRHRRVNFGAQGLVGIQDVDRETPWHEQLNDLGAIIQGWTPACDYAFIAPQVGGLASPSDVVAHYGIPPLSFVRHLLPEFVPMPFGVQILTTAHLDKAHNLDDWIVDDLTHGRFLVRSKDLPSWYANATTDARGQTVIAPPELLASARADFGDMVLTPEIITERQLQRPS